MTDYGNVNPILLTASTSLAEGHSMAGDLLRQSFLSVDMHNIGLGGCLQMPAIPCAINDNHHELCSFTHTVAFLSCLKWKERAHTSQDKDLYLSWVTLNCVLSKSSLLSPTSIYFCQLENTHWYTATSSSVCYFKQRFFFLNPKFPFSLCYPSSYRISEGFLADVCPSLLAFILLHL